MALKIPGVGLQYILDNIVDVEGLFTFRTYHDLVKGCYEIIASVSPQNVNPNTTPEAWDKFVQAKFDDERKYIDGVIKEMYTDIKNLKHSKVNILGEYPIKSDLDSITKKSIGDVAFVNEENRFYKWDGKNWVRHKLSVADTKSIKLRLDTSNPTQDVLTAELDPYLLANLARKKVVDEILAKYKSLDKVTTTNADEIRNLRGDKSLGVIYEAKHGDPAVHVHEAGTSGVFYGPQHKYHVKYPTGSKIMMMNDRNQLLTLLVSEDQDINKPQYLLRDPGTTDTYHAAVLMHESIPKTIPATYIYQVLVYKPGLTSQEAAKMPGYWELAYEKSYVKQESLETKLNRDFSNMPWALVRGYKKGKLQRLLKDELEGLKLIDDDVNSEFDVKQLQETLKGFQSNITKIHEWQNAHSNGHSDPVQLNQILDKFRTDISTINTHLQHNAQILDQMQNNIMRNAANIKLHEQNEHPNSGTPGKPKVLYEWYMRADAPQTSTQTHLAWIPGGYNFKYQKNKIWQPVISATNGDLRIFEEDGKVAYQELVTDLGWLEITAK